MSQKSRKNANLPEIHRFIVGYIKEHERPPSYREIAEKMGTKSFSHVSFCLRKLSG